jgi:sugar-specific transcriptional regulator TrmB
MDLELFKELGFTEREIKVYRALLELGQVTAGPIASKSKLAHTKVYDTIQRLVDKGLVTYITISKTKHFQAVDPKEILNILDERKRRAEDLVRELEQKVQFAQQKQGATVHEGFKAIKALFNHILINLQKNDSYYAFALKEDYKDSSAPAFLANFHRKLKDKGITDKAIAHNSIRKEILSNYKDNKNIQLRFTSRDLPMGVIILNGKVIQLIWGELPTAIEINSQQVYQQYKIFFESLWKQAKP